VTAILDQTVEKKRKRNRERTVHHPTGGGGWEAGGDKASQGGPRGSKNTKGRTGGVRLEVHSSKAQQARRWEGPEKKQNHRGVIGGELGSIKKGLGS